MKKSDYNSNSEPIATYSLTNVAGIQILAIYETEEKVIWSLMDNIHISKIYENSKGEPYFKTPLRVYLKDCMRLGGF